MYDILLKAREYFKDEKIMFENPFENIKCLEDLIEMKNDLIPYMQAFNLYLNFSKKNNL